ncbi:sensor histidine kinase [Opitutus terrae]|uniref:Signal transduction histidine kinase, LytS n=1 Tax=Opitutus terrae (strain DSM 11246 / JCM 15787 / PB90-1) TaxID=452637 RepID=B1ZNG7_OPITP|nr:histidine kinase [Opitutus terrae]ACB74401.1 signal transduction histidine kinase, LytS [Opitutus terrae PB90-1]
MSQFARVPLFWRIQLAGWGLLAAATFPLKLAAYDSVFIALAITLTREPLGLLLSTAFGWFYRQLREPISPFRLGAWITLTAALAGMIDTFAGRVVFAALGYPEDPLVSFGIFGYRGMLYVAWSLLYFWLKAQREARERELNLAQAETVRREAELQLLRAQVNPHFLFNALNTILATLAPDQPGPKRVVEGLAAFLRYSLSHRHDSTVPLGTEYDAAMHYLAVEQERFRGELLADCTIDDEARDLPVPGVLIQPLIENAVKYSRQTSEPPYRVRLRVTSPRRGEVQIAVTNTGDWVEPSTAPGPHGTGLENLRRRLALLYPDDHQLETFSTEGEVTVRIRLQNAFGALTATPPSWFPSDATRASRLQEPPG